MLLIHPVVQISASLMAIYVLLLGVQRFRMLQGQHVFFNWKRHVLFGKVAMVFWLAGFFGGMAMVYIFWHGVLITGAHGMVAVGMFPLIVFGLVSGIYMDRYKKKRKILNLLHGANNLVVLIMAFFQMVSGVWVYRVFVLGG